MFKRRAAVGEEVGDWEEDDSLAPMDWVEHLCDGVNEENAAGGRVVTGAHKWSGGNYSGGGGITI